MNVLFITRKYPPSIGGMQRLNYHLIEQMSRRFNAQAITWGGSQKALFFFLPFALMKAIVLVWRRRPDLICAGDAVVASIGWLVKRLFRVPVVAVANGLDVTFPMRLYQRIVPQVLRHCDRVVCISGATLTVCLERKILAHKCVVIHPGVEVPPVLPDRRIARQWLERRLNQKLEGTVVLLTVGRLVLRKGVAWFVEHALPGVLTANANVCYVIAGSGPERERIRALTTRAGVKDRVHLLDQVTETDLSSVFAASDIFLMPNIPVPGDMEGFGLVALEAAAHALPVLAADLGGIRDAVVPGSTGCLVPPIDANAWIEAVLDLAGHSTARAELGQQARVIVQEHHSWARMADAYEAVFREVVEENAKKRDALDRDTQSE